MAVTNHSPHAPPPKHKQRIIATAPLGPQSSSTRCVLERRSGLHRRRARNYLLTAPAQLAVARRRLVITSSVLCPLPPKAAGPLETVGSPSQPFHPLHPAAPSPRHRPPLPVLQPCPQIARRHHRQSHFPYLFACKFAALLPPIHAGCFSLLFCCLWAGLPGCFLLLLFAVTATAARAPSRQQRRRRQRFWAHSTVGWRAW